MRLRLRGQLVVFNTAWVLLWGVIALGDIAAIFLIPFRWWFLLAFITFGTCESIGLFSGNPTLPPLTDVIRRYLSYWMAMALIAGFWGAGYYEWNHRMRLIPTMLMFGLLGWFIAHFTDRYQRAGRPILVRHLQYKDPWGESE